MFKTLRSTMCMVMMAVAVTACGTDTTIGQSPTAASSPAVSHYNADLTAAYRSLQAIRVGVLTAGEQGLITKPKAQAIQNQCKTFQATLDTLAKLQSSDNQTILTNTIGALEQLSLLVAAETVKQ